jgi:hypothetical protein
MLESTADPTIPTALNLAPTKQREVFMAPPFEQRNEMAANTTDATKHTVPTTAANPDAPSTAGPNRLSMKQSGRVEPRDCL